MASIATKGRIERTPSTLPLFVSSVFDVTYELKEASFAVDPKKVIMQSKTTTSIAAVAADTPIVNTAEDELTLRIPKRATVKPQII